MGKRYQTWTQDQLYLLPPSMRDWLDEDHLAWFVLDVVSVLDISRLEAAIRSKDGRGQRPYDPRMMLSLLVYAYCTGVHSSRRIERACHESVPFRVISGNVQPHFTTINEFRRVHREHFGSLFADVLRLCRESGLLKLRHVAVDGTKVKANASKHKAMSYKRMVAEEKRLQAEVDRHLALADSADIEEDALHGAGVRGDELPEDLRRRESRLSRLREAKSRLEAQARSSRARQLREQARGMEATAAGHKLPGVRKGLRTKAAKRRAEAEKLAPSDGDESAGRGSLPVRETRSKPDGLPRDEAQGNFTDPESSIMKGADGFIQAYNAQLAVDEEAQVIVAQGVTNQPPDNGHLSPMLARTVDALAAAPEHATADAGYWNTEVEAQARELGTEAWVSIGGASSSGKTDSEAGPLARMRSRLESEEGKALYARRKAVVEPVNGQIKHARGFRQFSFRGLEAVRTEWALVCLCHNMLKLFVHRCRSAGASLTSRPGAWTALQAA